MKNNVSIILDRLQRAIHTQGLLLFMKSLTFDPQTSFRNSFLNCRTMSKCTHCPMKELRTQCNGLIGAIFKYIFYIFKHYKCDKIVSIGAVVRIQRYVLEGNYSEI